MHDNQSLSYGIWAMHKKVPTIATIHHPVTVDRKSGHSIRIGYLEKNETVALVFVYRHAEAGCQVPEPDYHRLQFGQKRYQPGFRHTGRKFHIVPNGINTNLFYPIPEIEREKNRVIVTNSADTPLKGLFFLFKAVAELARTQDINVTVVGTPKKDGAIVKLIRELGIGHLIQFTGRIDNGEFVQHYARATVAVVPSVYEGFGLPVGEAMACGVPVISTTGGALPEVAGDAAILVPPADPMALVRAMREVLENPARAKELGMAGYQRVQAHFTWQKAAEKTVDAYREVIRDYRRF